MLPLTISLRSSRPGLISRSGVSSSLWARWRAASATSGPRCLSRDACVPEARPRNPASAARCHSLAVRRGAPTTLGTSSERHRPSRNTSMSGLRAIMSCRIAVVCRAPAARCRRRSRGGVARLPSPSARCTTRSPERRSSKASPTRAARLPSTDRGVRQSGRSSKNTSLASSPRWTMRSKSRAGHGLAIHGCSSVRARASRAASPAPGRDRGRPSSVAAADTAAHEVDRSLDACGHAARRRRRWRRNIEQRRGLRGHRPVVVAPVPLCSRSARARIGPWLKIEVPVGVGARRGRDVSA